MDNKIELKTKFDHAKSFYKKAYYIIHDNIDDLDENLKKYKFVYLYSYNTLVLTIAINKEDYKKSLYMCNEYTAYSATTLRHVKEILQQFMYNTNVLNILYKKGLTKNNIIRYTRYNKEEI